MASTITQRQAFSGSKSPKAMKIEEALHMVGGVGETSYACNSRLQEKAVLRAKPILEEAINEVYDGVSPTRMMIADLGCSSGPNTLQVMSDVIDAVRRISQRLNCDPPEIQFYLNDLPGNDFNSIFRSLPSYSERGDDLTPFFVMGTPGSFYGRIFPRDSVHIVHSSFSLMWLSRVPQGLMSDMGAPLNKGNIFITKTSPSQVVNLYSEQYQKDFSTFLSIRSKEIIHGGRMVLTFLGRNGLNPSDGELCILLGLLGEALKDMALEGLLKEALVDDFNLPLYTPSIDEVKAIVRGEGSFDFEQIQVFELNWDPLDDSEDEFVFDNTKSGENVAKTIRAVMEPMLASHFGEPLMEELFSRYAKNVARHLLKEKAKYVVFTISLKTSNLASAIISPREPSHGSVNNTTLAREVA